MELIPCLMGIAWFQLLHGVIVVGFSTLFVLICSENVWISLLFCDLICMKSFFKTSLLCVLFCVFDN